MDSKHLIDHDCKVQGLIGIPVGHDCSWCDFTTKRGDTMKFNPIYAGNSGQPVEPEPPKDGSGGGTGGNPNPDRPIDT